MKTLSDKTMTMNTPMKSAVLPAKGGETAVRDIVSFLESERVGSLEIERGTWAIIEQSMPEIASRFIQVRRLAGPESLAANNA
jgi:hypothetical protein